MARSATGESLEGEGVKVFEDMGLACVNPRKQVLLHALNPGGCHSPGDHVEFDFLIPYGRYCLVGEITSRNANKIKEKYSRFRRHYDALISGFNARQYKDRKAFWRLLGVPDGLMREFRDVTEFRGFLIASEVEKLEVDLKLAPTVAVFFAHDWGKLKEYSACIGQYAKLPFLDVFSVRATSKRKVLKHDSTSMLVSSARFVTTDCDHEVSVIMFKANPYEILTSAAVDRRDLLPRLDDKGGGKYQRMLIPGKLFEMRRTLRTQAGFTFPGAILAVLSPECTFDPDKEVLEIPLHQYGALSIVDGQHRLFAYADSEASHNDNSAPEIMINALYFMDEKDREEVDRFSARLFIEINTNQTKVSRLHLEGIAFEILGKTDRRSIAAHVLRKLNERQGGGRGLFRTNDFPRGKIQVMEIVAALSSVLNPTPIARMAAKPNVKPTKRQRGYENIFGKTIAELSDVRALAEAGTVAVERYYNALQSDFSTDWAAIRSNGKTALELSKMHAAFIKLLGRFISEGKTWEEIDKDLDKIRKSLERLRRGSDGPLLELNNDKIPDARSRISDMFVFLDMNRKRPTSIRVAVKKKR